jgi:twitching motility protein PilT
MINTARIAEMIREPDKTDAIPKAIEEGRVHQMQSYMQHLVELVLDGVVDPEVAANASSNRHDFELALSRAQRAKAAEEAAIDMTTPPGSVDDIRPVVANGLRLGAQ